MQTFNQLRAKGSIIDLCFNFVRVMCKMNITDLHVTKYELKQSTTDDTAHEQIKQLYINIIDAIIKYQQLV